MAASRLGFSEQHLARLIEAGEIQAERVPGSDRWHIPFAAVRRFEERMAAADRAAAEFSRSLDELGSPLE